MSSKSPRYDALIDSDAFVGLIWTGDLLHTEAVALFDEARQQGLRLVTTSLVVAETATVLSHRSGAEAAQAFLSQVTKIPTIHITEDLQSASLRFFAEQSHKGVSVVDCSNIVVMRHFGIGRIVSFDGFYRRHLGLKPAA